MASEVMVSETRGGGGGGVVTRDTPPPKASVQREKHLDRPLTRPSSVTTTEQGRDFSQSIGGIETHKPQELRPSGGGVGVGGLLK